MKTDDEADPTTWTEGYVVFDGAMGVPMVFEVTDKDTGLHIKRAAVVSRTYEGCRKLVAKVFGEGPPFQDPRYPDRCPPQSMVYPGETTCKACVIQLVVRLNLEALIGDDDSVWWVKNLKVN